MIRVDSEKDHIKAIKERAEEEFGLCPKFIDSVAKVIYDDLYNQSKANTRTIERAEIIDTFINNAGE